MCIPSYPWVHLVMPLHQLCQVEARGTWSKLAVYFEVSTHGKNTYKCFCSRFSRIGTTTRLIFCTCYIVGCVYVNHVPLVHQWVIVIVYPERPCSSNAFAVTLKFLAGWIIESVPSLTQQGRPAAVKEYPTLVFVSLAGRIKRSSVTIALLRSRKIPLHQLVK